MSWIRPPAVAGHFYPGEAGALRREIERCLGSDREERAARAVVCPHAGTIYSGPVAGAVYARVRVPARCLVLSPNHTGQGERMSLWPRGTWRTPIGDVPVDEELASAVASSCPDLREDRLAHAREHSLEVHLPFLIARRPDVSIVPITLGWLSYDRCEKLGRALAGALRGRDDVLIVASTDMSHYIPADDARALDHEAIDRILALDAQGLYDTVSGKEISMCGVIPTTVALVAAGALGSRGAELVRYGNSGDRSGDYSSVVGYAGLMVA